MYVIPEEQYNEGKYYNYLYWVDLNKLPKKYGKFKIIIIFF